MRLTKMPAVDAQAQSIASSSSSSSSPGTSTTSASTDWTADRGGRLTTSIRTLRFPEKPPAEDFAPAPLALIPRVSPALW